MSIDERKALADVNRGLAELRSRAEDPEVWATRNAEVSGWSVAQQVHHASMVAGFVGTGLRGLLRGRGEEGPELAGPGRAILDSGVVPRGVAKAPKQFEPDESPESEAVLAMLAKAEKTWKKVSAEEAAIEAATLRLPHPILGPMNAAEWVRFAGVHTDHHLGIVRDILAV